MGWGNHLSPSGVIPSGVRQGHHRGRCRIQRFEFWLAAAKVELCIFDMFIYLLCKTSYIILLDWLCICSWVGISFERGSLNMVFSRISNLVTGNVKESPETVIATLHLTSLPYGL